MKSKSPRNQMISRTFGTPWGIRTPGLLVRRLSQGQIGAVSAPICAFYRHSLGGFSIVSVQPCLLFSDSGSKVGQDLFAGGFQCGNVDCSIGVNNSVCCEHLHRNSVVHQTCWCNLLAWGYSWVFFIIYKLWLVNIGPIPQDKIDMSL